MDLNIHSDMLRGNIETVILRCLFDGDKYGYEICKDIEERTHGQYKLKQPTLYSCLSRLEAQSLVEYYWDESNLKGGRRKYFRLTQSGRDFFSKKQTEWEYSRTIINKLISDNDYDLSKAESDINLAESQDKVKPKKQKPVVMENTETENDPAAETNDVAVALEEVTFVEEKSDTIISDLKSEYESLNENGVADTDDGEQSFNKTFEAMYGAHSNSSYASIISATGHKDKPERPNKFEFFKDFGKELPYVEDEPDIAPFLSGAEAKKAPVSETKIAPPDSGGKDGIILEAVQRPLPKDPPAPPKPAQREFSFKTDPKEYLDTISDSGKTYIHPQNYKDKLAKLVGSSKSATYQDFQTPKADSAPTQAVKHDVRETEQFVTDDGIVRRNHNKSAGKDYNRFFCVYANKLRMAQFAIVGAAMLFQLLIIYLIMRFAVGIPTEIWIYVVGIIISIGVGVTGAALYAYNPNLTKRVDYSGKVLITSLLITIAAIAVIILINLAFEVNALTNIEYLARFIVPGILSLNVMLSDIVYVALYHTSKFNMD